MHILLLVELLIQPLSDPYSRPVFHKQYKAQHSIYWRDYEIIYQKEGEDSWLGETLT